MAQGGHTRFKPGHSGNPKGKPRGTKSKVTKLTLAERKALLDENEWLTPLRYLMSVMVCEDNDQGVRMDAARYALPYIHRKMPQAVEFSDPAEVARSLPPLVIQFTDVAEDAAATDEAENKVLDPENPQVPVTEDEPAPRAKRRTAKPKAAEKPAVKAPAKKGRK
jgi:hypothetical protein